MKINLQNFIAVFLMMGVFALGVSEGHGKDADGLTFESAAQLIKNTQTFQDYQKRIKTNPALLKVDETSDYIEANLGENLKTHFTKAYTFRVLKKDHQVLLQSTDKDLEIVWKPAKALSSEKSTSLKLGSLIKEVGGCGCSIQDLAAAKSGNIKDYLFFADGTSPAWINLNGKDVQLDLKKGPKGMYAKKLGEKIQRSYGNDSVTLNVELTATKVCGPDQEGCEVNKFDAVMELKKGSAATKVQGKAECGC